MKNTPAIAAHTPGPWSVNRSVFSSSATAEDHVGTPNHTCAVVYTDMQGIHIEEQAANARLIAAAPELLALARDFLALMECPEFRKHTDVTRHGSLDYYAKNARAAIAKATA